MRQKSLLPTLSAPVAALALFAATPAFGLSYDQDVTPELINGTGIANGFFTVDRAYGVEVGLRGKLRHNATGAPENTFNSNGDGTYSFDAIVAPTQPFPTAVWSFEWSINTNYDNSTSWNLDDLNYALGIDIDPSLGTNFLSFDPINAVNPHPAVGAVQWDHAIGDNTTGNGGGTSIPNSVSDVSGYADLIANNNVAQQSWKAHWFIMPGFDPTVDGTYDFYLAAFDGEREIARTEIQIIAGAGGQPVPDSGATALLMGAALLSLAALRRRLLL